MARNSNSTIAQSEQQIFNQGFDNTTGVPAILGLGFDGTATPQRTIAQTLALQTDYDANGNLTYLGIATPGTLTSAASWQIKKLSYNGSGNLTSITWADSGAFSQIWDNHTGLTYVWES